MLVNVVVVVVVVVIVVLVLVVVVVVGVGNLDDQMDHLLECKVSKICGHILKYVFQDFKMIFPKSQIKFHFQHLLSDSWSLACAVFFVTRLFLPVKQTVTGHLGPDVPEVDNQALPIIIIALPSNRRRPLDLDNQELA